MGTSPATVVMPQKPDDYFPERLMRQLEPREIYLLLYGPDSLASSWRLRSLRKELKDDPEIKAIRVQKGGN